jgi:NUMOD3 motif
VIDSTFYIYFHRRPDTGEVFYVGRGKRSPRGSPTRRAHVTRGRSKQWQSIVDRNSGMYAVEIVEWHETFEQARDREAFHIKAIGRKRYGGPLINLSDGGDGIDGYVHTPETCAKLVSAWKRNPDRIKVLQSDAARAACREALALRGGPMAGKKHSAETRAKYSNDRAGSKNHQARRVVNKITGDEFGCVGDAARSVGLSQYTLYNYLLGNRKNTTPLEYA